MNVPNITQDLWDAYEAYLNAKQDEVKVTKHLTPLLDDLAVSLSMEKTLEIKGKKYEEGLIMHNDDVYLASEEDAMRFYKEAHAIYVKEGYEVTLNYCPILIAHSQTIAAKQRLVEESFYLVKSTGLKKEALFYNLKRLDEYVDTTCRFLKSMGMCYRIEEGYDHVNSETIYRVVGCNNEYSGEWCNNKKDVQNEKNALDEK